jgi:hypothetical protein
MTYTVSFCEYDIKWIPLLCQKENIDSYKKVLFARLQVEFSERSYGYIQDDRPTKWKLAKQGYFLSIEEQLFEWHLKWNSIYDAKLDSHVARVSDEEIKMAKMRDQAKAMESDHERVAKVKLIASRDFEISYPSLPREAMNCT